jgi:hypothetical protein
MMEPEDGSNDKQKWGQRGCNKMTSGVVYVKNFIRMGFHLKQGKRSNALLDFKIETISQSPSQIGGKCLRS